MNGEISKVKLEAAGRGKATLQGLLFHYSLAGYKLRGNVKP